MSDEQQQHTKWTNWCALRYNWGMNRMECLRLCVCLWERRERKKHENAVVGSAKRIASRAFHICKLHTKWKFSRRIIQMQVHFYKIFSELHKTAHEEKMAGRTRIHTITRREREKKNLSLTAIKLHKMTHYIRAPEIMPTQVDEWKERETAGKKK